MNTKRCQICWTGTSRGEFMGIPMCLECLSHRFEIDRDKLKEWEERPHVSEVEVFDAMMNIPKLKPESEWQWWQGVARSRAYEILDESVREIERLRVSEHDARVKFNWMLEHNACNRIPQHQPTTDAVVQMCACCGRMFRKSEMGHVGNEVYKCRQCLMGRNDG